MDFSRMVSVLGLVIMLFIAYLVSKNRKAIQWKTVGWGVFLQFLFVASTQLKKIIDFQFNLQY